VTRALTTSIAVLRRTVMAGLQMGVSPGSFLTKDNIGRLVRENKMIEREGKDPTAIIEEIVQWSYDLHLGPEAYLSSEKTLTILEDGGDSIVIQPGEFALLMTDEKLNMPTTHVGFISLKLGHALKGLVNISGFHVDPDFHGRLVFSVYNAGPNAVVMRRGEAVFMIVFARLDGDAGSRSTDSTFRKMDRLKSEWISSVKGPAVSLTRLNAKVERLGLTVNLLAGLIVSMLATLIVTVLLRR
jgi:dCTP deaminase